jgi:O-methyltransferase
LIIDDFGHWEGAQKAVMEYFSLHDNHQFLHRIDYTGRLIIKTHHDKTN